MDLVPGHLVPIKLNNISGWLRILGLTLQDPPGQVDTISTTQTPGSSATRAAELGRQRPGRATCWCSAVRSYLFVVWQEQLQCTHLCSEDRKSIKAASVKQWSATSDITQCIKQVDTLMEQTTGMLFGTVQRHTYISMAMTEPVVPVVIPDYSEK